MPRNYVRKRPYNKDGSPRKAYTLSHRPRKKYTRSKVRKIPLPIHLAFAYGRHTVTYPNRSDEDTSAILRQEIKNPMPIARWVNLHIPRPLPELPEIDKDIISRKLEDSARRGIKCHHCQHIITIYSWTNAKMPTKYQQFVPQILQECQCKQTAVLVDSLGRPNIFADHQEFSYCTPIGTLWFDHSNLQEFRDIPKSLVDTKPWVRLEGQRLDEYTDMLEIGRIETWAFPMVSPILDTSSIIEHLRRYAYTFKIIIKTPQYTYLPDGTVHHWNKPKAELYKIVADRKLELRSYPKAILPYLQITQLRDIKLRRYLGKPYVSTSTYNALTKLRTKIAYIVRNTILHKNNQKHLRASLSDRIPHRPLKIPPTKSYIHSFNRYLASHWGYKYNFSRKVELVTPVAG